MKRIVFFALCAAVMSVVSSCSRKIGATHMNGWVAPKTTIVSYNELTMDLDDEPITYIIDISTEAGRAKLNNLTLEEAKELALVEAIMYAKCATIFQPQYRYTCKKDKVLGISIYGFPARYKKSEK